MDSAVDPYGGNVEVKKSHTEGLGIYAARSFAPGDVIREVNIVREVTKDSPLDERAGEVSAHCSYENGRFVLYGYPDRHLSHSCDPNVYYDYVDRRQLTRALRHIASGEELTIDYLINNEGGDSWPCNCRSARCRGLTGTSFFDLPIAFQKDYLPLLAPWFRQRNAEKVKKLERQIT